jgi:hypothetical protein
MFNPGDYTIEKLRYAKDFKIYPPVDASFRYETLSDDDPRNLDDTNVQDMSRGPYYVNRRPPNPRKPKSSRFEPSSKPHPRNEEGYDLQARALLRTLKNCSFKRK